MNELLEQTKTNLNEAVSNMENKLQGVRAGRANPSMLDPVMVDYYGTSTPLRSLATISVPEARELRIKPFDMNALEEIEKGIIAANLGMMPTNNGEVIILTIPILTEETRKEFVKEAKALTEEGKIAIRNLRQRAIKDLETLGLPEDEVKSGEKRIQDMINDTNKRIDDIFKAKEKDLMSI